MRDRIRSSGWKKKKKGCAEEAEALCLPGETAAGLKRMSSDILKNQVRNQQTH